MKKLLSTSLILSSLTAFTAVGADVPRNKSLDRMMYMINPQVAISGPVFKDQATKEDKNAYMNQVLTIVLNEAHAKAKSFLEAGDTQAYYAFLTLALTVPMQEGLYIQYRNVDGNISEICKPEANSGELVAKLGAKTSEIFQTYFKTGTNQFLLNCEEYKGLTSANQIIRGGDGSDLSIMQVSLRWHFEDFLANKKYLDLNKTIQYGLNHLMSGFNPVYRNIENYPCLVEKKGLFGKKKISYENLIRGTWAGKYNSGSINQTCRFADSSSAYKSHDKGFLNNLNKFLAVDKKLTVDMVGEFELTEEISSALKEIMSNLKNEKNDRISLDKVLTAK